MQNQQIYLLNFAYQRRLENEALLDLWVILFIPQQDGINTNKVQNLFYMDICCVCECVYLARPRPALPPSSIHFSMVPLKTVDQRWVGHCCHLYSF